MNDDEIPCPRCSGPLDAQPPKGVRGGPVTVRFDCRGCGLSNLVLNLVPDPDDGGVFVWWDEDGVGDWRTN